jgi:thiol-disulfide isomerase/thioredoxin
MTPRTQTNQRAGQRAMSGSSNRARRRVAQQQAAKRRRWGWISAAVVVVVVVGLVVGLHFSSSSKKLAAAPTVGQVAPNATFTTLSGKTETVASLRGQPTLLWLMTTWCSSCQAGTQAVAQNFAKLKVYHVHVVQVENYQDLGQSGPTLHKFGTVLAGADFGNPRWTFGHASAALTHTYNPQGDLDIYYLLNAKGQITYVNSEPASTMPQLLAAAGSLT